MYYGPFDEDYGYVTLEGFAARRPVVTLTDAGGPLEFVTDGETGLVTPPEPQAIAHAFDRLFSNRALAQTMGEAGNAKLLRDACRAGPRSSRGCWTEPWRRAKTSPRSSAPSARRYRWDAQDGPAHAAWLLADAAGAAAGSRPTRRRCSTGSSASASSTGTAIGRDWPIEAPSTGPSCPGTRLGVYHARQQRGVPRRHLPTRVPDAGARS